MGNYIIYEYDVIRLVNNGDGSLTADVRVRPTVPLEWIEITTSLGMDIDGDINAVLHPHVGGRMNSLSLLDLFKEKPIENKICDFGTSPLIDIYNNMIAYMDTRIRIGMIVEPGIGFRDINNIRGIDEDEQI